MTSPSLADTLQAPDDVVESFFRPGPIAEVREPSGRWRFQRGAR